MKDEKFDQILAGLKTAYQEKELGQLPDSFAHGVLKRVRYVKARKEQEALDSRSLFEAIIVRVASGAVACALLVVAYGGSKGIGLTGAVDMVPANSVEFVLQSGVLL